MEKIIRQEWLKDFSAMPLSCQSRGWEHWNICSRQCSQHRGPTQTNHTETGKQSDAPSSCPRPGGWMHGPLKGNFCLRQVFCKIGKNCFSDLFFIPNLWLHFRNKSILLGFLGLGTAHAESFQGRRRRNGCKIKFFIVHGTISCSWCNKIIFGSGRRKLLHPRTREPLNAVATLPEQPRIRSTRSAVTLLTRPLLVTF